MRNFLTALFAVFVTVLGFSAPAFASDMPKKARVQACASVIDDYSRLSVSKRLSDKHAAETLQLTRPECFQQAEEQAPPMDYTPAYRPLGAVCNAVAVNGSVDGGRPVRGYAIAAATYTDKHMHDENTGVDKSDLGLWSPEIGAGVCVGLMPRLGAFGEAIWSFNTDSVTRGYPTGWTEKDKLSMVIGRIGLMYNVTDRIAIGGYAAVGQGWLKYNQSLDWYGTTYTNSGTSTATFAGVGGQLEYAFTNNLSGFVRGEKLWMVSGAPVGQNKTDMERIMVGLKGSVDLFN
jgi:hypothetical protein